MQKFLLLLLILSLTLCGQAEIRLINGTGKVLKVDVLSKAAQDRDVVLPADRSMSQVLGGKLEENKSEVLVIKDANGKEIERTDAQTNGVFAINNWGSGVSLTYLGRFQGRESDVNRVNIINSTGKVLEVKLEYDDFSVYTGKTRTPNDEHGVTGNNMGHHKNKGEKVKASISGPGVGNLNQELEVGGLYLISGGPNLSVQRIR